MFIQIATGAILARLLTANDFGVVAITGAFTGILMRVKDGGLSLAVIQADSLSEDEYSNLYWVNCILGVLGFLLCVLIGYILSLTYEEPKVFYACVSVSISFLAAGTIVQPDALLRRKMQFRKIALLDVWGAINCSLLSVAFAYYGFGYLSLTMSAALALVLHALVLNYISDYKPFFNWRRVSVKEFVLRGGAAVRLSLSSHLSMHASPVLIGYYMSTASAGVYNRVQAISNIPAFQLAPPVLSVFLPLLVNSRNDLKRFDAIASGLLNRFAYLGVLLSGLIYFFSYEITIVFLGSGWVDSSVHLRQIAPMIGVECMIVLVTTLHTATQKTDFVSKLKWMDVLIISSVIALCHGNGLGWVIAILSMCSVLLRLPIYLIYLERNGVINLLGRKSEFLLLLFLFLFLFFIAFLNFLVLFYADFGWGVEFRLFVFSIIVFLLMCFKSFRSDCCVVYEFLRRKACA